MQRPGHSNLLVNETSPYLLQHAHNPVDWHPWNEETLSKARSLDRMMLVSIGYSSCHWCHVMEKESFVDEEVAALMNRNFICIKVDREERPDVDQVYMTAVQLISGGGGWPLNCFTLPDGRPFFGGTYFRKDQWIQLLENIVLLWSKRRGELESQAESLAKGVRESGLIVPRTKSGPFTPDDSSEVFAKLSKRFDMTEGGLLGAPKFPMPVVWEFVLKCAKLAHSDEAADQLKLTLKKMACGGIYDHLGGGFARYSTDNMWRVPHFEKMLYDNAQLISLYANAYRHFHDPLFLEIVTETMEFVFRELTSVEGAYYTALDADSEGIEGKYYQWSPAEVKNILGSQAELMSKYFHLESTGIWEGIRHVLYRTHSPQEFAKVQRIPVPAFKAILKSSRAKLFKDRQKRIRPGLDDKVVASWNALMIQACADAFRVTGKEEYLDAAVRAARFIQSRMMAPDGTLGHSWGKGRVSKTGFLEDYAFLARAMLSLHEATMEPHWLDQALGLAEQAIREFYDRRQGMFHFTATSGPSLFARKTETSDNVTPSSNAVMAVVLHRLGHLFDREDFVKMASGMLSNISAELKRSPWFHACWGSFLLDQTHDFYIMAVTGEDALAKANQLGSSFLPNAYITGSASPSEMPYLANRYVEGKTLIYVCKGDSCLMPVEEAGEAIRTVG